MLRQWIPHQVSLCVSLCLVEEVISYFIVPVLGIMPHITSRKLKHIMMLLFHSSALALHCVLRHDMLHVTLGASLHPGIQMGAG